MATRASSAVLYQECAYKKGKSTMDGIITEMIMGEWAKAEAKLREEEKEVWDDVVSWRVRVYPSIKSDIVFDALVTVTPSIVKLASDAVTVSVVSRKPTSAKLTFPAEEL